MRYYSHCCYVTADINGCSEGAHYCHDGATCNNSQGSRFSCNLAIKPLYCYLSNSTALSPGTIAGIIVGTITGLVLITGFIFIVFLLRKLISGMRIIYVSEDMKQIV